MFHSEFTRCKIIFLKQLIQYWPDYVVNCCTGGDQKNNTLDWTSLYEAAHTTLTKKSGNNMLKQAVRDSFTDLEEWLQKTIKYREDFHPSRWIYERKSEKKDG